jgi:NitT/TauT family transport system permease protein
MTIAATSPPGARATAPPASAGTLPGWAAPAAGPARLALRIASLLACVLAWQWASSNHLDLGLITFRNVPPPAEVLRAGWDLLQSPLLLKHLGASLARVFAGFAAAALAGVALGLLIGRSRWAEDALLPPLEMLRPIPAVAWIPLAILMFPSSELSMIFITFTGARFPILLNTIHGVEQAVRVRGSDTARRGAQHRYRPGNRHGHGLVLPRHRRDDLGPVRHRLLHLGFVHHPELRRHRGRHAGHRPVRHG